MYDKKMKLLIAALILTALGYLNIFSNQFAGDDFDFIHNWTTIQAPVNFGKLLAGDVPAGHGGVYRPVRSLVYAALRALTGTNVVGYHIFSLVVHLTTTAFIFGIAYELTNRKDAAFLSATLFGLHPVHVESITWITGSFDAFGFMLFFGAYYAGVRYLKTHFQHWLYAALVLSGLAFFAEELALTLVPLMLLTIWLLRKSFTSPLVLKVIGGMSALTLVYAALRLSLHIPARGFYLAGSFWLTLMASVKAFMVYVATVLFPVQLTLDHVIPPNLPAFTHPALIGPLASAQRVDAWLIGSLLLVFVIGTASWGLRKKLPLVTFCLVWFVVALLPVSNLLPSYTLMREMYLYIASFGVCLLIGFGLAGLYKKHTTLSVVLSVIVIGFYMGRTMMRNRDWHSDVTLWQSATKNSQTNPLAFYMLGSSYQKAGQNELAIQAYNQALHINDSMAFVDYNLGTIYVRQENYEHALKYFDSAIKKDATVALYYLGAVRMMVEHDQYMEGWYYLERAYATTTKTLKDEDELINIAAQIGQYFAAHDDFYMAEIVLTKTASVFPHSSIAATNTGILYAQYGNAPRARDFFQKALNVDARNAVARDALKRLSN